jgi:hypothetical protein
MIETQTTYKLTLTEDQAKELFHFLQRAKDIGHLSNGDLIPVLHDLKTIFQP